MVTTHEQFTVVRIPSAGGGTKTHVEGGLDLWEYVFIARTYGWDIEKTANHLQQPEGRVRQAVEYYRADPHEVDVWLQQMDAIEADPEGQLPGVRVVRV